MSRAPACGPTHRGPRPGLRRDRGSRRHRRGSRDIAGVGAPPVVGGDAALRDTDFCIEALEEALQRFEAPDIFNTDQGCQFTSDAFTDVLKGHAIAISMDGKGRWVDNVFVERLWRSVKSEDVYLRAYETPTELRAGLWPATSASTTPGAVTAHWTDATRMRCTSTRLTAIWQSETRGRFHLPHCPILGVHFCRKLEPRMVPAIQCVRRTVTMSFVMLRNAASRSSLVWLSR